MTIEERKRPGQPENRTLEVEPAFSWRCHPATISGSSATLPASRSLERAARVRWRSADPRADEPSRGLPAATMVAAGSGGNRGRAPAEGPDARRAPAQPRLCASLRPVPARRALRPPSARRAERRALRLRPPRRVAVRAAPDDRSRRSAPTGVRCGLAVSHGPTPRRRRGRSRSAHRCDRLASRDRAASMPAARSRD